MPLVTTVKKAETTNMVTWQTSRLRACTERAADLQRRIRASKFECLKASHSVRWKLVRDLDALKDELRTVRYLVEYHQNIIKELTCEKEEKIERRGRPRKA